MIFVRRHSMLIIISLTAIVAACLTDFLMGAWAQHYASGDMDGLGWIMAPLVRYSNTIGSVTTFFVLWLAWVACIVIPLSPVLFKRRLAPVED